jgi:Pyridoxal phosphate biosynthesis protein PdxJ
MVGRVQRAGAHGIEIYTGSYAEAFRKSEAERLSDACTQAAQSAFRRGLTVNIGHDLNLANLPPLIKQMPPINEASIGHELTADALLSGFGPTVAAYKSALFGMAPRKPTHKPDQSLSQLLADKLSYNVQQLVWAVGLDHVVAARVGSSIWNVEPLPKVRQHCKARRPPLLVRQGKRKDSAYRPGSCSGWIKSENRPAIFVNRSPNAISCLRLPPARPPAIPHALGLRCRSLR